MTKLCFNYKDIFRSLRLGFSAKKIWMMFIGLLFGFGGYSGLTYLAHAVAGNDLLSIWETFRLLPFADPLIYPFPWYSWVIYGLGVVFFACSSLVTGTAVSKIAYEQLRGDEFYESREAFRFAFKNAAAVLASPLLLLGFVAIVVIGGLLLSLVGAIPYFGEVFVGLMALPAFAASLFIVYLLLVLLFSLLIGPSIVGATRNDTFDTLFEVFSCVNEQPGRLIWYMAIVGFLSMLGSFLLTAAAGFAGRIGEFVLQAFMGGKMPDVMANGAFYFRIALPEWWPELLRSAFVYKCDLLGLSSVYLPGDYFTINWGVDIASVLVGLAMYVVAIMTTAFGCSVWYSGNTMIYAVLAHKKDDRNILEMPDDIEELIEPVVDPFKDSASSKPETTDQAAAGPTPETEGSDS